MSDKLSMEKQLGSTTHVESTQLDSKHSSTVPAIEIGITEEKFKNPLAGISKEQLILDAEAFAVRHGLEDFIDEFRKGALVAQNPLKFEGLDILSEEEKNALRNEITQKWKQPKSLYVLVALCSVAAAVQGMDETVSNGAQLFFAPQFGVDPAASERNQWLLGLIISAPYLCCAVLSCWLTDPLNKFFGRRGTVFISATITFLACIWQAVTTSWPNLLVARLVLGLGIGPNSATVPVFAAECAPPAIRGALVMMWQVWTAFGIMLGFVSDLIFLKVHDPPHIRGLNWRLMLASAGVPSLIVMSQVFFCPESPRWLMKRGEYKKAFDSFRRLRIHPVMAARDLYHAASLMDVEASINHGTQFKHLFTVPRNRRATQAAFIVMFMQQFCGINAIAYYSTVVFKEASFTDTQAFLASFGFGAINFVFALPAVKTIDTFGRRNLLLTTFPFMSLFLLLTGFAFFIPQDNKAHLAIIALGIYLFGMVYSPGAGPVPFTYSAESFPLHIREIGMSFATAICWFFNFIISITFPAIIVAFKPQGAFGWYAAWNIIGWVLVLLFVPETKALSLEDLDQVFNVPTRQHASYQLHGLSQNIKKYIFRIKVDPLPPLYQHEKIISGSSIGIDSA